MYIRMYGWECGHSIGGEYIFDSLRCATSVELSRKLSLPINANRPRLYNFKNTHMHTSTYAYIYKVRKYCEESENVLHTYKKSMPAGVCDSIV